MPPKTYKYKKRRAAGNRKPKKPKRRTFALSPTMSTPRGPLGATFAATLKWYYVFTLDVGAGGACANHVVSTNGLYDPSITHLTNHQPRGFDELMTFYNKYTVVGSKCTATFNPSGALTSSAPYTVGLTVSGIDDANQNYPFNYIELGNCVYRTKPIFNDSTNSTSLSCGYSTKRFHGLPNTMDNGAFGGDNTANPTKGGKFIVWAGAADQVTDLASLNVAVLVEYRAIFHDPRPFAAR